MWGNDYLHRRMFWCLQPQQTTRADHMAQNHLFNIPHPNDTATRLQRR